MTKQSESTQPRLTRALLLVVPFTFVVLVLTGATDNRTVQIGLVVVAVLLVTALGAVIGLTLRTPHRRADNTARTPSTRCSIRRRTANDDIATRLAHRRRGRSHP